MLTIIGYTAALIAILCLALIDIAQRHEIKRLNALLTDQAAENRKKVNAAFRQGWNRALAKVYPSGLVPERVMLTEEDKVIATS